MLPMTEWVLFFHEQMSTCHKKAWPVVKMVLVLSHGQATVERGFSINKEEIVENQHVESLVAQSIIKDHIQVCLLYTSPSPRDRTRSRMPSSA